MTTIAIVIGLMLVESGMFSVGRRPAVALVRRFIGSR